MKNTPKDLLAIFRYAVNAVAGKTRVEKQFLTDIYPDLFHVVAIGKAADSMMQGVPAERIKSGLLITKQGYLSEKLKNNTLLRCIESDHPVPKQASLNAGQALIDYLARLPEKEPCLFLISGGTSALVEVLQHGWDLSKLQALTHYLLENAYSIDEINTLRRSISRIKGGGLWSYIGKRPVFCLMISDVPDDDPAVIGSGLLFPAHEQDLPAFSEKLPVEWLSHLKHAKTNTVPEDFSWKIIATLSDAKQAAANDAEKRGYRVKIMPGFLRGEAVRTAAACVDTIKLEPGTLFVWGGETVVNLPQNAGKGGRNLHLALAAAIQMKGLTNTVLLAAGTDGSDGTSDASGAVVDGITVARGLSQGLNAAQYLKRADAYHFFVMSDTRCSTKSRVKSNALIVTGATGTNVMDLVFAISCA